MPLKLLERLHAGFFAIKMGREEEFAWGGGAFPERERQRLRDSEDDDGDIYIHSSRWGQEYRADQD